MIHASRKAAQENGFSGGIILILLIPGVTHKGIKRLRILYHACLIRANRKAAGLPATDDFLRKDFRTKDSEMILKK